MGTCGAAFLWAMGRAEPWLLGDTGSTREKHPPWAVLRWESHTSTEIQGQPVNKGLQMVFQG